MPSDNREPQRVSSKEAETIRAVVGDGRQFVEGVALDVSALGVGIAFQGAVPAWTKGSVLRVVLHGWKRHGAVELDAAIVSRATTSSGERCGFRFTDSAQLGVEADLFNRRRAFRVEPDSGAPIDLWLQPIVRSAGRDGRGVPRNFQRVGDEVLARLHDVSVDGLGALVDPQVATAFERGTSVLLRLVLTESTALFQARVVRQQRRKRRLLLGLTFDDGVDGFPTEQSKVTHFVMARQRQWLQRTRNPSLE